MRGRVSAAAFFVAVLVAAGKDAPPTAGAVRACSVYAYVIDKDPKGVNVRAEPNGKAKILGALREWTELQITGVQNGWLRIAGVSYENDDGSAREDLPQSGWVSRRFVGTETRNYGDVSEYFLHESPDEKSKRVGDPENGTMKIVDCDGTWAKVEAPNGKSGWLPSIARCANFRTNCS